MPIKTFRGQLTDGAQQKIRLSTNNGMTGYRIVKLQMIPKNAGTGDVEGGLKIFKVFQDTVDGTFDFTDSQLLGGAYASYRDNSFFNEVYIFDQEVFNQDIFITYYDSSTGQPMNYYLELELIQLNKNSQSVVTLKDIRTNIN